MCWCPQALFTPEQACRWLLIFRKTARHLSPTVVLETAHRLSTCLVLHTCIYTDGMQCLLLFLETRKNRQTSMWCAAKLQRWVCDTILSSCRYTDPLWTCDSSGNQAGSLPLVVSREELSVNLKKSISTHVYASPWVGEWSNDLDRRHIPFILIHENVE